MTKKYLRDTPCQACGNEYCDGDSYDRDMCWFFEEQWLHARGTMPRNINSCNTAYVALVVVTNLEADAEYDGFPVRSDLSDEQVEAVRQNKSPLLHVE